LPSRAALLLALCAATLAHGATADAAAAPRAADAPRALLVFAPLGEHAFAGAHLSVGIVSATQGAYSTAQLLLDVTQGARVAAGAYARPAPALTPQPSAAGAAARVTGFADALRRARTAPARLDPGLLAGTLGGAAYVGAAGVPDRDAVAAAGPGGVIAAFSRGREQTLTARIGRALRRWRLVVADLPAGAAGVRDLRTLAAARREGELLIVLQRVPGASEGELLWGAAAGLAGASGTLTSATTRERGLVAAIDVLPTILGHLHARTPGAWVVGSQMRSEAGLDGSGLTATMTRLRAIPGRRLPALAALLGAWVLLVLVAAAWQALRPARRPPGRAPVRAAVRAGAVGLLWTPLVSMVSALLAPAAGAEYALIAVGCLSLGVLSDRLLGWPRALLAPALAVPAALALDALAHTQLLMRSLLGPDPVGGARFYGLGNELKAALAVLVLGATAAALHPARRDATAVLAFAGAGAALAALEGAPSLGAGAGGAALCCAGFATAALLTATPRARSRTMAALLVPAAALALLGALALVTGAGPHGYGGVGHVGSLTDLRDLLVRRARSAWQALADPAMACVTALAALAGVTAVRRRARLLEPVGGDPAVAAALAGGLAAGATGALSEDSGPLLFVQAIVVLAALAAYLHARAPVAVGASEQPSPQPPLAPSRVRIAQPSHDASELAPIATATIAALGGSDGTV
jgi:hypothetical protein